MPQIAISVDMLDTGIDVPQVLNLVFFKKVMSKAKFWQMIGRGTRLCPDLMDGEDKDKFYIFDFCNNFEFFRMNKGRASANNMAIQGSIFSLEFEMAYKLQDIEYQEERLIAYRKDLVKNMQEKVKELPRDNFAVKQHLRYVDTYSEAANYDSITFEDTLLVKEEVAPLIRPDGDEISAVRFDALMYGLELAYLAGKNDGRYRSDLLKKVSGIATVANIPEVQNQKSLIQDILNTDYLSRIFKKEKGISISNYIIQKRVEEAKKLLTQSTLPINTVSLYVGYSNFSYFTKMFKDNTGYAPLEYRRSFSEK